MRNVAEMLAGSAAVVQVNIDSSPRLAARYNVTGVPVIILLRQGKVVDQLSGARAADSIARWFRGHEPG